MGRAFITAYTVTRGLDFTKEIKRLPGLREVNYGDAANMSSAKAYELYPKPTSPNRYNCWVVTTSLLFDMITV